MQLIPPNQGQNAFSTPQQDNNSLIQRPLQASEINFESPSSSTGLQKLSNIQNLFQKSGFNDFKTKLNNANKEIATTHSHQNFKIGKPAFQQISDTRREAKVPFVAGMNLHIEHIPHLKEYRAKGELNGQKLNGLEEHGSTLKELEERIKSKRYLHGYVNEATGADNNFFKGDELKEAFKEDIKNNINKENLSHNDLPQEHKQISDDISRAWEANKLAPHGFLREQGPLPASVYDLKREYIQKAIADIKKHKPQNIKVGEKDGVTYFDVNGRQVSFHGNYDENMPKYDKDWIGKKTTINPLKMSNKQYEKFKNFIPKKVRNNTIGSTGLMDSSFGDHIDHYS